MWYHFFSPLVFSPSVLHYFSVSCIVGVSSLGVSIGEGIATLSALNAISRQPGARSDIIRAHILGAALIEGSAIFGLLIAMLLIGWTPGELISLGQALAEVGICVAMSVTSGVLGVVSGLPITTACESISRQPFMSQKIISFMVMTLALIQTPLIAALMISACIKLQMNSLFSDLDGIRLMAAGITIGLGSFGPGIGLSLCAKNALKAISLNKKSYNKILSFTLLSEAIIETPVVFAIIISLLLLFAIPPIASHEILRACALVAASFCVGIGTFGTGIGSGSIAKTAVLAMGMYQNSQVSVARMSFFSQGLVETTVIYATLIGFVLMYIV
jgi:F-type H+-transporting ATPase subunit c